MTFSKAFNAGLISILFATPSAFAAEYVTDTLRPGEDLSTFAYRTLGTHKRWREIYQLNAGTITDLKKLVPGTVLNVKLQPKRTPVSDTLVQVAAHQRAPEVHAALDPEEPVVGVTKVEAPHSATVSPFVLPLPVAIPVVRAPASSLTGTRGEIEAMRQAYDEIQYVPEQQANSLAPFKDLEIP